MTLEGSYPNLIRFINRMEQSKVFWIIKGMNVGGSNSQGLRLTFQMETYAVTS
jgi:hypothetical protein